MSGYLSFELTGDKKIDEIILLLNEAGDTFHSTEGWLEPIDYYGNRSFHKLIQIALNRAAKND